jgi:hypothetical protein
MILAGRRNDGAWMAWLAVAYAAYIAIFLPLLPADGHGLGHDYALHLPNLLAGYFYYLRNGLLAVPWFNPGQCGGVPFIADLNVGYYSLPQFLTFIVDPLAAVRATFAIFAAIGAVGTYVLIRRRFRASDAAAAVAAVLFLFNGFYAYRVIIGHLTFHPFALTPWLAVLFLPGIRSRGVARDAVAAIIGGAFLAYMFQAGMVHGMVPVALAVAVILLAHGSIAGHSWRPWRRFAAAIAVSLALSASRLVAALAFLRNFPRSEYPLPGFASLADAFHYAFLSLFWEPSPAGLAALSNTFIVLDRHEWEYGVSLLAAGLIAVGAVAVVAAWVRNTDRGARLLRALPVIGAVAVILFLPLALNWYVPAWNAFLKEVPLLASSSSLLRWFALYIPVATLFAGLAVDRAVSPGARWLVVPAVVLLVVALNAFTSKAYYTGQHYNADAVTTAWRSATTPATVPPVTALAFRVAGMNSNAGVAIGHSDIDCYQPMFGYYREHLVTTNIHAGPVTDVDAAGNLNLKNPACYVFPAENACRPGDDFSVADKTAAASFVAYRSFEFRASMAQHAADWLNLAALIACAGALIVLPLRRRGAPPRLDANRDAG